MLEGAVARLLNQLLGKYVTDLDTENLNVGIFSGHVQLTDLKLKSEALYELKLPIEVTAGTIGKVWLQIPWTSLWSQPIVVNIEDIHLVVEPIVSQERTFDAEKNKRLIRAMKKKIISDLDTESEIFGGPSSFAEHLVTNILNCLQLNITNVHIRYEDSGSARRHVAAGLTIGSITAESTNSKWKPAPYECYSDMSHYLIKFEAVSMYWNANAKKKQWNLPTEYYNWRNAMSSSLQNYSINDEQFDFLVKPMTSKIKIVTKKSKQGYVTHLNTDIILQDCNIQVSKDQYESIVAVFDSLERMNISWSFLAFRPKERVLENRRAWWKYCCYALLEQRVKPYTWSKIKAVRAHYKEYIDTYKQIILNPNDTELKLDLQKHEDNLSVTNVVIARQYTRLLVQSRSIGEKSFWSILPSPERLLLCEKIGFFGKNNEERPPIENNYNFRIGNISAALTNHNKEILMVTLTQMQFSLSPKYGEDTYKAGLKIEGLIVEGASSEDALLPIISSEHLSDSPAYFFKADIEKLPKDSLHPYRLNVALHSVECLYNKQSLDELEGFFDNLLISKCLYDCIKKGPHTLFNFMSDKLEQCWDMNLHIKMPYIVIPESRSFLKTEHILVVDLGKFTITSEICQQTEISENATQMELEEQLYSKLNIDCSDIQILFCDTSDNWKDARKEKDTEMHIIPKTNFSSVYAVSVADLKTIPWYKFNLTFQNLKVNISERKIGVFLKYFNIEENNNIFEKDDKILDIFLCDRIKENLKSKYLYKIQENITILSSFSKGKKNKSDSSKLLENIKQKSLMMSHPEDMNEAWARCVDLPGLEDNISPNNNIDVLLRVVINEFSVVFSRSSDSTDRQYLMLRLSLLSMDVALMTFGPAYQISVNSILLTDKLHTTPSGQYLDLIYSPLPPNNTDVITILYRKVSASCPDFWSHFHGVETSLVANLGNINLLLHQEAVHTIIKYSKYMVNKVKSQISQFLKGTISNGVKFVLSILHKKTDTPVPPGSVKFSHSARLGDLNIIVCDSDFDIVNIQMSGLEMDFLFRANERFVFRSYLSNINVEHMSDITLYSKVLTTDEDKVFEVKYVRNAPHLKRGDISGSQDFTADGTFKFQLGRIHCTFLYKLIVQLQRFIINMEALPYLEASVAFLNKAINKATATFTTNTKINLAINVCGPVLLFPQKSSSPNVMVIDTGELHVENFFKDYPTETIENILLKLSGITVTRGVMTLTSTLEMQESLIEPICMNMDIKRYTNSKTSQKSWDIDSVIETIQITLGQRDLSTLFSIYTDNIGEGQIQDLFPNQIKSPSESLESDETVKTLEAFFCEPKQKNIVAKCAIEEIQLLLFFDSGELLSSPIRDLNHGLCKLSINDLDTSFVVYTDKSVDGKLSIDQIAIEEIGPDANIYDKIILQSPTENPKNNNCNITVNKPPLIDITFHQNKSGDKSADMIIGRLSLSLSVPFCEKLALFALECLPKDNVDTGIINPGYEADIHTVAIEQKSYNSSLTVSLRINKPELIFLVETTSNKKRYFITKSEILLDYSRHGNRLNLVTSFSGLHTLFYDIGVYSSEPYVILKQCDVEFCKCFTEEKGNKISLSISSIYVRVCSEVVHSLNDILNDIVEHFKVPDRELKKETWKSEQGKVEDLWEPKKITEFIENAGTIMDNKTNNTIVTHEILLIPKFEIIVVFELEQVQVLLIKSTIELTLYDWSSLLNCTCEVTLQGNYFNESLQTWEPFIDPIVLDETEYRPWDILFKIYQDKSMAMLDTNEQKPKGNGKVKRTPHSCNTTEDEDSGEDMMYLEPINSLHNGNNRRVKTSLSTFLDDSDSENEDETMEKLAAAISDLFTGDWNEHEDSDCDQSSDGEEDNEDSVKEKAQEHSDFNMNFKKSLYILVDAKDTLNVTITPVFLKVLNELYVMYSTKILSVLDNRKSITLTNDIAPQTKIELYEKTSNDADGNYLISVKTYEKEESVPNSPTKTGYFVPSFIDNMNDDKDSDDTIKEEQEFQYDFETLSSLQFPIETTSQLFDKINRHFMKIYVPNFHTIQTNCPKRNWEKLIRLQSNTTNQTYYLAAKHTLGKNGRNVVISPPLQIKNETCFALSILYQPSVLQQLGLEPLGDITNPFETTMRIAVLEAYEQYNVPLHIAYHCKLFIQPAYAEGHYASENGIWWKDLATELDTAINLRCKPKSESNLEVFSLRVMMKRNLEMKNSQAHSIPNYVIHLLPPLILHNYLPYSLEVENIQLKQLIKVEPGEKNSVYSLDLSRDQKLLVRVKYNTICWTGHLNLTTHLDEKIIVLTSETTDNLKTLGINVKSDRENSVNIFFYAPYWIINKTGLPLEIKASATNSTYKSINEDILLFTYKRHGKQTLNVRVYESNWSNEFGLECSGTTGLVVCKDNTRKKKYLFFLNTKLSQICPRLTKIVTLLPSFIVTNNTDKNLRFMEHNEKTDLWVDLSPYQNVVFWPETSSMQMYVKYRDSKLISQAFYMTTHHKTVLRMDRGGALTVEVTGGINEPFRISFQEYKRGDAPVLVKNYCADVFLKIQQQDQSPVTLVNPYNCLMYTWDDPTRSRQLVWNIYNNKGSGFFIDITKDGYGEEKIKFHSVTPNTSMQESSSSDDSDSSDSMQSTMNKKVRKDKIIIYWLCYREGLQRILLFTQELRIYNNILRNIFQESSNLDCLVSLSGVGFSIFTSENAKKEHVYLALADTPAVWEVNVGHKWKTLTLELASWVEDKYRLHYKKCQLKDYIHIDFEKMFMLKPFFAELRRSYSPAVYFHVRKSNSYQYYNLKIQNVQVDNKYSNAIVLHPVPSSNIKETNPFVDVGVSKYISKDCDVYRYIKVNVGDMYLNIENDLFLELSQLFSENKRLCSEVSTNYVHDISSIHSSITIKQIASDHSKTVIENISVNSFSVQLNIMNKVQISLTNTKIFPIKFLDYLFPINISPYMPMEGVHHKISSIELIDLNQSLSECIYDVLDQITTQFLQQYYSHVLGLQVLVNSFAITPSIEYTHVDTEKIVNLLLYGSRCLLGHINMSPAALEQCIVDIFINQNIENIQRIRRHGSYYKSEMFPKAITISSRNFNTGVPNALNQIIVKHHNAGINCDGEMFFKTTGKALLSLITRHPDEKSDSVEVAREALRRASILGEPIKIHQRLARYCNKYLGLKPMSVYESMGQHLLETVGSSRFINDSYWNHAAIDKIGKSIIIVSLEHVIRINKCRLWGPWEVEWIMDLDDIVSMPKVNSGELVLNIRPNEANVGDQIKINGEKEMLLWLHEKIEQAIIVSMEDKSWALTDN